MKHLKNIFGIVVLLVLGMGASAQDSTVVELPPLNSVIVRGLANNFDIKINQKLVDISQGQFQAYRGAFDPILAADATYLNGTDPTVSFRDKFDFNVYIAKPTRYGFSVATGANFLRMYDLTNNDKLENVNGLWFQLDLPLLKNMGGNNINYINYQVARLNWKKAQVNFDFQITTYVKDVVLAYIRLYMDKKILDSYDVILEDLKQNESNLQQQIDKGFIPQAEVLNVQSSILQSQSERKQVLNNLNTSYVELMRLLGDKDSVEYLYRLNIQFDLPLPDHKKILAFADSSLLHADAIVKETLDFYSQKISEETAAMEMKAAKNQRLHDLNLQFRYNYYAEMLDVPWSDAFVLGTSHFPGSSYLIGLNYRFPIRNSEARGRYLVKSKAYELESEATRKFLFEKKKAIQNVAFSLRDAVRLLSMQESIVKLTKQVYENEVLKYNIGQSTQMDVLNANRDYREALLGLHESRFRVAELFTTLKFLCNGMPSNAADLNNFDVFGY